MAQLSQEQIEARWKELYKQNVKVLNRILGTARRKYFFLWDEPKVLEYGCLSFYHMTPEPDEWAQVGIKKFDGKLRFYPVGNWYNAFNPEIKTGSSAAQMARNLESLGRREGTFVTPETLSKSFCGALADALTKHSSGEKKTEATGLEAKLLANI